MENPTVELEALEGLQLYFHRTEMMVEKTRPSVEQADQPPP